MRNFSKILPRNFAEFRRNSAKKMFYFVQFRISRNSQIPISWPPYFQALTSTEFVEVHELPHPSLDLSSKFINWVRRSTWGASSQPSATPLSSSTRFVKAHELPLPALTYPVSSSTRFVEVHELPLPNLDFSSKFINLGRGSTKGNSSNSQLFYSSIQFININPSELRSGKWKGRHLVKAINP